MSDVEQNRSEQATPYKLMRARERGTVARGMDLGFLTALATFAGYFWFQGPVLAGQIALSAQRSIVAAPNVLSSPNELLAVTGQVLSSAVRPLAFMAAAIFVVVLVFEIVQTGIVFSTEPLRPDFSRLNPTRGFKRVFSIRMLIETGKNVVKLAVYASLAWVVISGARGVDIASITDAPSLAGFMQRTGLRLVAFFLVGAVFFAIVDQLITRWDFGNRMRMSRREVRREARDREGDPRMKQRRRKLHRDFVNTSQSVRNIRGADVLITNPTHFAVALRYDAKTMIAPTVVSLGAQHVALRLKKLAFVYGLEIVENPALARALYAGCKLNEMVPEALYRPVADVYLAIRDRREQMRRAA
ncbi:MAG TPA: EscU/YscU/HrcU family type III secretion system export apparatus switch protein [Caulobacteraceae bacterium]|jgi:flagellar biosynthetic protein FlhB